MITFTLNQLAQLFNTPAPEKDLPFKGISTDTRTLQPGNLFIALEGENHDGHLFIEEAQSKGAVAALVMRKATSSLPQTVVVDTVKALGLLATAWRKQFDLPMVGLTGSNGKTTLKNLVASILRAAVGSEAVLATEGNLNNHIGVPLMLARLNENHQYGVIEMGMNHFGEIAYLTQMVMPQVAIVNNAATAHLQGVNDLAGVAKAKGEIFQGLSATGTAILNADDTFCGYWQGLIEGKKYLSFGIQNSADISAIIHESKHPFKQQITIITPKGNIEVLLPLLGQHNVMNALAATATCLALNISLEAIKKGLENIEPAKGRLQVHSFAQDIHLIDDTYNANPASLQAAINVLASFEGDKVLVLGDMRELGDNASDLHANMGKVIKAAGIQHLYTYGELSKAISENFGKDATHFPEQQQLIETIKKELRPHSTYLIKGSRSMKMENVVNAIKQVLQ
jgi:UDP-N-acetylmuramoyl-tripeptide--D-alanyl-D-alanine ligase